jgi:hypothetical protein
MVAAKCEDMPRTGLVAFGDVAIDGRIAGNESHACPWVSGARQSRLRENSIEKQGQSDAETIGVIAMGEMGSATARRLRERGATVITSLAGRSAASAARAEKAGAIPVSTDDEFVAQSDFILSIVPPGDAVALAERLAPAIKRAGRKTGLCRLQRGLAADRGADRRRAEGPAALRRCRHHRPAAGANCAHDLLCVGPGAKEFERLRRAGLTIRVMDGPNGAASAMKLSTRASPRAAPRSAPP